MCEPTTLMAASAVIGLVGTGVSVHGQRQAAKANAQIAEQNARLAEQDAATARAMGDRESQQQTWRMRALEGQQRAAIAAQGIDAQIGTPLEILGESAMFGEVDQQAIRLNAARQAWGFNAQATSIRNQSRVDQASSRMNQYGTILSGLSSAAGAYGQAQSAGFGAGRASRGAARRAGASLYAGGYRGIGSMGY